MTIALVTGCAGFIGSTLTDELLRAGGQVRGIDSFTAYYERPRKEQNLEEATRHAAFELLEDDLLKTDLDALVDGVDIVYHLAGQPGVRASWADGFADYVERNVVATQRLLEAAKRAQVPRLVYASSSSIYGNAAVYPVTEDMVPHPHSPYGVTKLAGEHLCTLYAANWGLPTVSLRYFSVYGPRQRPDMAFDRFIRQALDGQPLPVFGTGEQVRDFTYVGDVVRATLAAASADVAPGTVCNVAGGSAVRLAELFPLIGELIGEEVQIDWREAQPGDVERTGGSGARAGQLLGWTPMTSLREGVSHQVAWVKAHR